VYWRIKSNQTKALRIKAAFQGQMGYSKPTDDDDVASPNSMNSPVSMNSLMVDYPDDGPRKTSISLQQMETTHPPQPLMHVGSFSSIGSHNNNNNLMNKQMIDNMADNVNLMINNVTMGGPDSNKAEFAENVGSINSVNDVLMDDIVNEMETPQYAQPENTNDYVENVDTGTDTNETDEDDDVLLMGVNTLGGGGGGQKQASFDDEEVIGDDDDDTAGDRGGDDDVGLTIGDEDDEDDDVLMDINAKVTLGGDDDYGHTIQ